MYANLDGHGCFGAMKETIEVLKAVSCIIKVPNGEYRLPLTTVNGEDDAHSCAWKI